MVEKRGMTKREDHSINSLEERGKISIFFDTNIIQESNILILCIGECILNRLHPRYILESKFIRNTLKLVAKKNTVYAIAISRSKRAEREWCRIKSIKTNKI